MKHTSVAPEVKNLDIFTLGARVARRIYIIAKIRIKVADITEGNY
jgi:hypothetical protein